MKFSLHSDFPTNLKFQWDELLNQSVTNVPFLKYGFLDNWWATRGGAEWPQTAHLAIVTASQDDTLSGIAPLFINRDKDKTIIYLLGSKEICDYLDVIARPDDLETFMQELMTFLTSLDFPHWDQLVFHNLIDTSPTVKALADSAQKNSWDFKTECVKQSPCVSLAGDWEAYLASIDKKQRHEIRRKMRRAEENTDLRWYIVEDAADLDEEIDAFLQLMAVDDEKDKFLTALMREQMRRTMQWAFEEKCLQLSFLEIHKQKAASYFCFDYQNKIMVYNSGFDPSFSEYSPGWVLVGNLLKWSNENNRVEFDFMRGDEDYKYRFGAKDRFVVCAIIDR